MIFAWMARLEDLGAAVSEVKASAYELMEAGMPPDLVYETYLGQQGLKASDLSYEDFKAQFYGPGGKDITELRANPRKDAFFGFNKILGSLLPKSLQDKHDYFDPARIEAKDYSEFKKKILSNLAPDAGSAARTKYQKLLSSESFDFLFQNLYRSSHQTLERRSDAPEGESPEAENFDGELAKQLLSQLECEFREIEANPEVAQEESFEKMTQLLGPLVPALLRDANGRLDLGKIKAKNFAEFKNFLRAQVSVDGIAFNSFWLDSYKKVLGKEEFEPLLRALYDKSKKNIVGSIDASVLQQFTAEIVQVSAERFVQHHMNQPDGRQMLRGILGDPSHYTKEIRSDVVKAIASVGEAQEVAGHARYHSLTNNISTWNYFNVAVTDEELENASRIADGILDGAEYMEEKAEAAQRMQQEEPDKVWVLEEEHAGRKISAEDIKSIQKLIEEKQKKNDPQSQVQVKLAKFWMMTVDNRLWGSGGPMELGVHRGYLLKRTEALLEQSRNMASEAEFLGLNEELQDFLHGELNSEGSPTLNWIKDKTVGHGLADVFERMPEPLKAPYEDLKQFSDEVDYAHAMGQRFHFIGNRIPSGDPQIDAAALEFIHGLQQSQRSLWYGYKQHKLLSRSGSQIADVVNLGDVAEIREANQVIDGMIERLQRVKNKSELEKEITFLNAQLKEEGILHQALIAAEMDGFEQLIGLGQTIAVIAAITLITQGSGTSPALAEAAEGAQALTWAARAAHGIQTGATLTLVENGISILSGEVRQGEDTALSLAKDSLATGVAMGFFTPFGAQVGHSLEKNLIQRLFARYTEGSLTKNILHFASDTALEFGEELFDASLRGTLDGKPEISFDQFREIGLVTTAGGGTKMGSVVSSFRNNSTQPLSLDSKVSLDQSPANDNASLEEIPSLPEPLPNQKKSDALPWAVAAGLVTLLTPDIADAATVIANTPLSHGFWPGVVTAFGLGTLGILGMSRQGKQDNEALLRQLDEQLLAMQLNNLEDPAVLDTWAVIADMLGKNGDSRGYWIQLALKKEMLRQSGGEPSSRMAEIDQEIEKLQKDTEAEISRRYVVPILDPEFADIRLDFEVPYGFILSINPKSPELLNLFPKLRQFLSEYFTGDSAFLVRGLRIDSTYHSFNLSEDEQMVVPWIGQIPALSQLISLELLGEVGNNRAARSIAKSNHFANLLKLELLGGGIGDGAAKAIATSPQLSHLVSLNLGYNSIGDRGAKAIGDSTHHSRLISLDLSSNEISEAALIDIAQSEKLRGLSSLVLDDTELGSEARSKIEQAIAAKALKSKKIGEERTNNLYSFAGPALLGVDFLIHGQPTLPGALAAGLATLASTRMAAEYYSRFSNWVRGKWVGDGKSTSEETLALGFMANSDAQSDSFAEDRGQESEKFGETLADEEISFQPNFKSDPDQGKSSFVVALGGGLATLLSPDIANAAVGLATQISPITDLTLPTIFAAASAFLLGMTIHSKDDSGQEYSEVFEHTTISDIKEIHTFRFEGTEWKGVADKLERIREQIDHLPPGKKFKEGAQAKRAFSELLFAKEAYSPNQFFIILGGFEEALAQDLVFGQATIKAHLVRATFEKEAGEKIDSARWLAHMRALTASLDLPTKAAKSKMSASWVHFYDDVGQLIEKAMESSLASQHKSAWIETIREQLFPTSPPRSAEALSQTRSNLLATFQSSQKLKSAKEIHHRVVWNPFAFKHREKLVLHPSNGEAFILDEQESRLKVRFIGHSDPVLVNKDSVVRPDQAEQWQQIVDQRIDRVRHFPYFVAPLALRWLLDEQDLTPFNLNSPGGSGQAFRQYLDAIKGSAKNYHQAQLVTLEEQLAGMHRDLGIDPIKFVFQMLVGELPTSLLYYGKNQNYGKILTDRLLTPDLVREFLLTRPWVESWKMAGLNTRSDVVQSIGFYYPQYYREEERPSDLTEIYFDFRNGDPKAFREVTKLFQTPIQTWAADPERKGPPLLLPMIGAAPLASLAKKFGLPVSNPWVPRPVNYGDGVEGLNAHQKWKMVDAVLKINPKQTEALKGKSVLILDDNLTDGITYMVARRRLLKAGAAEVRLLTLTQTLRHPRELEWDLKSIDPQERVAQDLNPKGVETGGVGTLLAALGAGLATLLSPDIAETASDVGHAIASQGFWAGVFSALGLGALGMVFKNDRYPALLQNLEDALLVAQVNNPEDPAILGHWAIISDLLLARGDPRGEWIQLELTRERLENSDDPQNTLEKITARIEEIRGKVIEDIQQRFGKRIFLNFIIPKGFSLEINRNTSSNYYFLQNFFTSEYGSLTRELAIHHLTIFPRQVDGLFDLPCFKRLISLDLRDNGLAFHGSAVQELAQSTNFPSLVSLDLSGNALGIREANALAQSENLSNLVSLNLSRNMFGDEAAEAIAASPGFPRLTSLNLRSNSIGKAGARAIAASPNLGRLTQLNLLNNGISKRAAWKIAQIHRDPLIFFSAFTHKIDQAEEKAILESPGLPNLKVFNEREVGESQDSTIPILPRLSRDPGAVIAAVGAGLTTLLISPNIANAAVESLNSAAIHPDFWVSLVAGLSIATLGLLGMAREWGGGKRKFSESKIIEALEKYNGERGPAARELGMSYHGLLYRIIKAPFDSPLKAFLKPQEIVSTQVELAKPSFPESPTVEVRKNWDALPIKVPSPRGKRARFSDDELASALEKHGGNRAAASAELGISGPTLSRWIDESPQESELRKYWRPPPSVKGSQYSHHDLAAALEKHHGNVKAAALELKMFPVTLMAWIEKASTHSPLAQFQKFFNPKSVHPSFRKHFVEMAVGLINDPSYPEAYRNIKIRMIRAALVDPDESIRAAAELAAEKIPGFQREETAVERPKKNRIDPDFNGGTLLAALGAGLATLLSPDVANAAADAGSAVSSQGFWPAILAVLGAGALGILGMTLQKPKHLEKSGENPLEIFSELAWMLAEYARSGGIEDPKILKELSDTVLRNTPEGFEQDISKKILAIEQLIHNHISRDHHLVAYQGLAYTLGRVGRFIEAESIFRDGKLLASLQMGQDTWEAQEAEILTRITLAMNAFDFGGMEGPANPFYHLYRLTPKVWDGPLCDFLQNLLEQGEISQANSRFEALAKAFDPEGRHAEFIALLHGRFLNRLVHLTAGWAPDEGPNGSSGGQLHALAGPAIPILETLINGQPSASGILLGGLGMLASAGIITNAFTRLLEWVKSKWRRETPETEAPAPSEHDFVMEIGGLHPKTFFPNGNIGGGYVDQGTVIQGIMCDFSVFNFYEDGNLKDATLWQDQALPGTPNPLIGKAGTKVHYWPNGQLESATLAKATTIEGQRFAAGDLVVFLPNGHLISVAPAKNKYTSGGSFLIALGTGLTALFSPDVANAASNLGEAMMQNGTLVGILAALGIASAGALAMAYKKDDRKVRLKMAEQDLDILDDLIFEAEFEDRELRHDLQSLNVEHIQQKASEGEIFAFRILQKLSAYYDNEAAREAVRTMYLDHWIQGPKNEERTRLLIDAAFWENEYAQWALILERGSDPVIDKFFELLPNANEPAAEQIRHKLAILAEHGPKPAKPYQETEWDASELHAAMIRNMIYEGMRGDSHAITLLKELRDEKPSFAKALCTTDIEALELALPGNWNVWDILRVLAEAGNVKAAQALRGHLQKIQKETPSDTGFNPFNLIPLGIGLGTLLYSDIAQAASQAIADSANTGLMSWLTFLGFSLGILGMAKKGRQSPNSDQTAAKHYVLYTEPQKPSVYFYQFLLEAQPGAKLEFSNKKTFVVKRVLSTRQQGSNTDVFDVGNGRAIRVMRHPHLEETERDFLGFSEGWKRISQSNVPTVHHFEDEGFYPEYLVVEALDIEIRLNDFFARLDQLHPERREYLLQKFLEFAETTAEFQEIGDFHAKQIGFSPSRDSWVLFDFNKEHEDACGDKRNHNAFQRSRMLFHHFSEIPDEIFLELNRRIDLRRIQMGFPPALDVDLVPTLPDLMPLYPLDDF